MIVPATDLCKPVALVGRGRVPLGKRKRRRHIRKKKTPKTRRGSKSAQNATKRKSRTKPKCPSWCVHQPNLREGGQSPPPPSTRLTKKEKKGQLTPNSSSWGKLFHFSKVFVTLKEKNPQPAAGADFFLRFLRKIGFLVFWGSVAVQIHGLGCQFLALWCSFLDRCGILGVLGCGFAVSSRLLQKFVVPQRSRS